MAKRAAPPDWTYHYSVTFRLTHPSILQSEMIERMGIEPQGGWTVGKPRFARGGQPLGGTYRNSYWWVEIDLPAEQELAYALEWCAQVYGPRLEAWPEFFESGGEANFYVGVSVVGHFPVCLDPELLEELARYRIELQLDVYAVDKRGHLRSVDD